MADLLTVVYLVAAGLVGALAFRDAPQRLARAYRDERVLRDTTYHVVNAVSVVVVALWLAVILLGWDARLIPGRPLGGLLRGLGLALGLAGFALGAWARVALGGAFAPTAAVPADERVVEAGPYGHVRHPFYVGLMLALAGGILALDSQATVIAWLVLAPLVRTIAVLEEEHLAEELGEAYEAYRDRVARWVPRPGRGRTS